MEFSERLICARKAKGLSQETLAEILGISRQAVSKWETGESKPDLDNLISLCKVLGIGLEYLCFGTELNANDTKLKNKTVNMKRIVIAVCMIAVFGIIAFFCGVWFGNRAAAADAENPVDYVNEQVRDVLYTVEIAGINVVKEKNRLLQILPSSIPEGLQMELLVVNTNNPETIHICCEYDGVQFSAEMKELKKGYIYRISAILTLRGEQRVIPLLRLETDTVYDTFVYQELWH